MEVQNLPFTELTSFKHEIGYFGHKIKHQFEIIIKIKYIAVLYHCNSHVQTCCEMNFSRNSSRNCFEPYGREPNFEDVCSSL
jgi:hypothetical protein